MFNTWGDEVRWHASISGSLLSRYTLVTWQVPVPEDGRCPNPVTRGWHIAGRRYVHAGWYDSPQDATAAVTQFWEADPGVEQGE